MAGVILGQVELSCIRKQSEKASESQPVVTLHCPYPKFQRWTVTWKCKLKYKFGFARISYHSNRNVTKTFEYRLALEPCPYQLTL